MIEGDPIIRPTFGNTVTRGGSGGVRLSFGTRSRAPEANVEELVEDVIRSINAIRISTRKLRVCMLQSGLPSFLR
jgi:hypothetical protein